jgi:hypothetical protein
MPLTFNEDFVTYMTAACEVRRRIKDVTKY